MSLETLAPGSIDEAASDLAGLEGARVRFTGGRSKLAWGGAGLPVDAELSTLRLDRVVEYNPEDLTLVVEAGARMAVVRDLLAERRQMLAIDPPLGNAEAATVGGVLSCAESGPLRHGYGAPRDLVLGMTVVLADGTVAASGGKVIKNVAGYDLAKLFTGSFGTLGLIGRVALRLHPLPARRATLVGSCDEPATLQAAVWEVSHARLQPECLEISWLGERGRLLVRFGGAAPGAQAETATQLLAGRGMMSDVVEDDEGLWREVRVGQRSGDGVVVKVSGLQTDTAALARLAADTGASLVGRAAVGVFYLRLEHESTERLVSWADQVRSALAGKRTVVLDAPDEVRRKLDVWGPVDERVVRLMRRVKERFDPAGVCNPGLFVGGL